MKKITNVWLLTYLFLTTASAQNANTSLSNLIMPTAVNQSLVPNGNNTQNLGAFPNQWKDIYLGGAIYFGGYKSIAINPSNIAIGGLSLFTNTTGTANTAIGNLSMYSNTTGLANSACGAYSLYWNTTGQSNSALGNFALMQNTTASNNTAMGSNSLEYNTTGGQNTSVGAYTLRANTNGDYNSALGYAALISNTTGYSNTSVGRTSMYFNTTGFSNSAFGMHALYYNSSGDYNTAIGKNALYNNTSSNYNTAIGYLAGDNHNLSYCTYVGYDANATANQIVYNNSTAIGRGSRVTGGYQVRIGNSSTSSIGGYENWTNFSDGRYKKNIQENVPGLEFIQRLRPITYTLDIKAVNTKNNLILNEDEIDGMIEKEKIVYTGFIAQDVEQAANDLNYKFSGVDAPKNVNDFYGLRYAEFTVPLVKAVQELSNQNTELKIEIEELKKNYEYLLKLFSKDKTKEISNAFLGQNIPNPFESKTTIPFVLPDKFVSAKIIIINLETGQLISKFDLSQYQTTQDLDLNLSSGIFIYSLIIDGIYIDTKQMLKAK